MSFREQRRGFRNKEGLGTQSGNSWDWACAGELEYFSGSCSLPVLAEQLWALLPRSSGTFFFLASSDPASAAGKG